MIGTKKTTGQKVAVFVGIRNLNLKLIGFIIKLLMNKYYLDVWKKDYRQSFKERLW